MNKISFKVPIKRNYVTLKFAFGDDFMKKISLIMFQHGISASEVVEMLAKGAMPEYFKQNPIQELEAKAILQDQEARKKHHCYNSTCDDKANYFEAKNMIVDNGNYFCSQRCVDQNKTRETKLIEDKKVTENLKKYNQQYFNKCEYADCPFSEDLIRPEEKQTLVYAGKVIKFCSLDCMVQFKADNEV